MWNTGLLTLTLELCCWLNMYCVYHVLLPSLLCILYAYFSVALFSNVWFTITVPAAATIHFCAIATTGQCQDVNNNTTSSAILVTRAKHLQPAECVLTIT